MKILVLGGAGLQGRAVLHDLSRSDDVKEVVCADVQFDTLADIKRFLDMGKIKLQKLDVSDEGTLKAMMEDGVDVAIVMLPSRPGRRRCRSRHRGRSEHGGYDVRPYDAEGDS